MSLIDMGKVGNINLHTANRFFITGGQEYISKVPDKGVKQFYKAWTKKKHI